MAAYIIFILLCVSLAKSEVCPNGWVRHDSSCYLFVDIPETWQGASAHCQAMNSQLAVVESSREDTFLRNTLLHIYGTKLSHYWLDGTDIATESEWVWAYTQNQISEYTNWHPGQPDDSNGEDCLRLTGGSLGFDWDDGDCESKDNFICERIDSDMVGEGVIG